MPAYGREYNSLKAVQADFDAGKDFRTPGGQYISIKELLNMGGISTIMCRYGKGLTKSGILKIKVQYDKRNLP